MNFDSKDNYLFIYERSKKNFDKKSAMNHIHATLQIEADFMPKNFCFVKKEGYEGVIVGGYEGLDNVDNFLS